MARLSRPSWDVRVREARTQRVAAAQSQEVEVGDGFLEEVALELSLLGKQRNIERELWARALVKDAPVERGPPG